MEFIATEIADEVLPIAQPLLTLAEADRLLKERWPDNEYALTTARNIWIFSVFQRWNQSPIATLHADSLEKLGEMIRAEMQTANALKDLSASNGASGVSIVVDNSLDGDERVKVELQKSSEKCVG